MPEFISKLQYKTYENGEYSDEKVRDLQETIELINNFPWAIEQYAHLGITGPSITIQDIEGNYLKMGIYYGGRFSIYYLDFKNHYYENRNISFEFAQDKVIEFFAGRIDLQNFKMQRFGIGLKKYFITSNFEYRIKIWKLLLLNIFWETYFVGTLVLGGGILFNNPFKTSMMFILVPALFFGWILGNVFLSLYRRRNQYLRISRGNDEFFFGDDSNEIRAYNKTDIDKILNYVNKSSRNPNLIEIYEVVFKNGANITFTNVLISNSQLSSKFSNKWKLSMTRIEKNFFNLMKMMP